MCTLSLMYMAATSISPQSNFCEVWLDNIRGFAGRYKFSGESGRLNLQAEEAVLS